MSKIYFASDFHLGAPNVESSKKREQSIVRWLHHIQQDASEIFLVGDLFDFWFEHRHTAPKGHIRFLGKIAELTDKGIPVHLFTGNHDMWMKDYLPREIGVSIHNEPVVREWNEKKFFIGHGDGLGPGDKGYKILKKALGNRTLQWLFARLHPNFSFELARFSSRSSRASTGNEDEVFLGIEKEWLAQFAKETLKSQHFDYFIFGHRHLPIDIQLGENSRYVNLGEWMNYNTYAVFDGNDLKMESWEKPNDTILRLP